MIRSLVGVSFGWLGISMVADGVPSLLVPHQVAASGGDATELGLVTLVALAIAAAIQPFAGGWGDRIGRFPVVVGGAVLALAGLALIVGAGALLVGCVLALAGVSVVQAGYQALLPDRIGSARRGRAAGAKGLFDVGGAFLAFALLAAVLAAGDAVFAALILALGLVVSLGVSVLAGASSPDAPSPVANDARADRSALVRLILARFLFLLGVYAVGRFLLLFVGDRLGLGADEAAADAGAALAILTLLTALAAVPAGWLADRIGRRQVMLAGGLTCGIGIAALPLAGSLLGIVAFGALMAIGSAAFGAGSWAGLADLTAGPESGRLLGIANLGTAGAAAAAGVFGPLIDAFDGLMPGTGYAIAFVLAGGFALAGGLLGSRLDVPQPAPALASVEVSR